MPRGYLKHNGRMVGSKRARGGSGRCLSSGRRFRKEWFRKENRCTKRAAFVDYWHGTRRCAYDYDFEDIYHEDFGYPYLPFDMEDFDWYYYEEDWESDHGGCDTAEEHHSSASIDGSESSETRVGFVSVHTESVTDDMSLSSWDLLDAEASTVSSSQSSFVKIEVVSQNVLGDRATSKAATGECCICFQERPLMKLMNQCKHPCACFGCLRRYYVTTADRSCYPLKCFHPSCQKLLQDVQVKRLVKNTAELDRHYCLSGQAKHQAKVSRRLSDVSARLDTFCNSFGTDSWARCPGCGMGIIKDGGCDYMVCFCGKHFDWSDTEEQKIIQKLHEQISELLTMRKTTTRNPKLRRSRQPRKSPRSVRGRHDVWATRHSTASLRNKQPTIPAATKKTRTYRSLTRTYRSLSPMMK